MKRNYAIQSDIEELKEQLEKTRSDSDGDHAICFFLTFVGLIMNVITLVCVAHIHP